MNDFLLYNFLKAYLKKYSLVFLTLTIVLFISSVKCFAEENVFTIDNVEVKGTIDLKFSRDKYLNKAFINSFDILMSKILLTRDLPKVDGVKLKKVRKLISSFQILEESYRKEEYKAKVKITFNEIKVKKFLAQKNISFSQPENISAIFFPVLFINGDMQDFNDNFFYREWENVKIKNELINFILPLEDVEDISKINEMKNNAEQINVEELVNKYDVNDYVFVLMDYSEEKLSVYLKTNFNNNKISKNISYNIKNFNDNLFLNSILKDLKLKITDVWKEENLINFLMPLSIQIKFDHKNIKELDKLRNNFYKISIIDKYSLEQFNINTSVFKIYYYGNPKKLKSELLNLGYDLINEEGSWKINLNE